MKHNHTNQPPFDPTAWLFEQTPTPSQTFTANLRQQAHTTFRATTTPWYRRFGLLPVGVLVGALSLMVVTISGSHWQYHQELLALHSQQVDLDQEVLMTSLEMENTYTELDSLLLEWENSL